MRRFPRGFTLIELLVVIAVISLLSSVILSVVTIGRMKARDAARLQNARQLSLAVEQYEIANGTYKVAGAGFQNSGGGLMLKSGTPDYANSIVSALSSSGVYGSGKPTDPAFADDNYYLGLCTSTSAYSIFLKVEQPVLQSSSSTIASACDGTNAATLGFNFVLQSSGSSAGFGSSAGAGGGGGSSVVLSLTYAHALAVANGKLYAWGNNGFAELGGNRNINQNAPIQVGSSTNWVDAATGYSSSYAINTLGQLYAWGYNNHGQLGNGTTTDVYTGPLRIGVDSDWAKVEAGQYFAIALKKDGSLWSWGYNAFGMLGQGDAADRYVPTKIGAANDWKAFDVGWYSVFAQKMDGSLYSWGTGQYGNLGLGNTSSYNAPQRVGTDTDWKTFDTGYGSTIAIKNDGSLYICGDNSSGQLGLMDTSPRNTLTRFWWDNDWVTAAVGNGSHYAIKTSGQLYAWGLQGNGQLGVGNTTIRTTPVLVGSDSDWSSIAAGQFGGTLGLKTSNAMYGVGYNTGDLGTGNNNNSLLFVPSIIPW